MLKRLKMVGVAAAAAMLMAAPASAVPVIDFSTGLAGVGGTITWDGTNLVGTNIPIGAMSVTGAPSNNGVFLVSGQTTGSGGGFYGDLDFNTTPGANFISIAGCIPQLGIGSIDENGDCSDPEMLLDGNIQGWDTTNMHNGLISAFGEDSKNAALLTRLGLPTDQPFAFFGFSFTTEALKPNGVPGSVLSTDLRNTAVPEPATMMLLGTGLLAAFRARRRQA